ncbi:MAG TPA: deoxyhypusine synthase [Nitrososphaeraceae archaeon]|nr:deoxyhypusine synthase [Nitrososphaeraceae archaeon]
MNHSKIRTGSRPNPVGGKTRKISRKRSSNGLLGRPIHDYYSFNYSDASILINKMKNSGGFEAVNLANGIEILKTMNDDGNCAKFLSFVGAILSTGTRGIIRELTKEHAFDCIVTTCGALDHDIARTSANYYAGDFRLNDADLLKEGIHRLGNVLIPFANYGTVIEEKVRSCLKELYFEHKKRFIAPSEILDFIGSKLNDSSFLYWANKNRIPVIVPGIVDGAVGSQFWLFHQEHRDFGLDLLKDQTVISNIVYDAKRTGAFMIGGGISKHHTLWWNQFKGGLDYAVYLTTSPEWDGSLSGALVEEAISWGKITAKASRVTIHGEATTLLPFIYAALHEGP